MEMIENYLYAIGKKLPRKQNSDILRELRSIIMDNLDDCSNGKNPTQEEISKVLLEMGSPSDVAKRYRTGPSWIIGPLYYDTYIVILKIVLAVTLGAYLLSLIISMLTLNGNFGQRIWNIFIEFFDIIPGLFSVVGIVTLIFILIERAAKKPIDLDFVEGEKWNPSILEAAPVKEERIKPIESILGIVFPVIALILFNVFRENLGLYYTTSAGGAWDFVEIFNQSALDIYIPLWSILWALSIGLNGWLLSTGKHNTGTKVFELVTTALNVGILFYIANGPILFKHVALKGDLIDLKPIVSFLINNQSTIFFVLAVLTLIGLIVSFVKFIIRKVRLT